MKRHLPALIPLFVILAIIIASCGILYGPAFDGQGDSGSGQEVPETISGLQFWLSADSGVTTHTVAATPGYVCTWADRSGNGVNATQGVCDGITNTDQPSLVTNAINGQPAIRFDDGNTENLTYTPSFLFGVSYTIFSVINIPVPKVGVFNPILGGSVPAPFQNLLWGYRAETIFTLDPGGSANDINIGVPTGPEYLTGSYEISGFYLIRKNGAEVLNTPNGADESLPDYPSARIGRYRVPPTNYFFRGDIAEIIIYDRALSIGEIQTIESYLKNKYGL